MPRPAPAGRRGSPRSICARPRGAIAARQQQQPAQPPQVAGRDVGVVAVGADAERRIVHGRIERERALQGRLDAFAVARGREAFLAQHAPLSAGAERGAEIEPGLGPLAARASSTRWRASTAASASRRNRASRKRLCGSSRISHHVASARRPRQTTGGAGPQVRPRTAGRRSKSALRTVSYADATVAAAVRPRCGAAGHRRQKAKARGRGSNQRGVDRDRSGAGRPRSALCLRPSALAFAFTGPRCAGAASPGAARSPGRSADRPGQGR